MPKKYSEAKFIFFPGKHAHHFAKISSPLELISLVLFTAQTHNFTNTKELVHFTCATSSVGKGLSQTQGEQLVHGYVPYSHIHGYAHTL